MTVGKLIEQLRKLDPSVEVTVRNDSLYLDGLYEAREIEMYGDDTVVIVANYDANRIVEF